MKWIAHFCLLTLIICSCQTEEQIAPRFEKLASQYTGIDFRNDLTETPQFNILEYLYFYNGSGVAIEDINNDGLPDIYLGSNQKADQLYLNQGDFKFKNISDILPYKSLQGWTTGVNMVDINADGWMDIYVSRLSLNEGESNKLFINQAGRSFIEQSNTWGLDIAGYCTHSSFFDYDNDGDLDCYILKHSEKDPDQFKKSEIRNIKDIKAGDLLLENINNKFKDKTAEANIYSSAVGFGLGVSTADLNKDGWMDIYVSNDFHEQDYLYINNQDKTFSEVISDATGHTSNFSMGCSIEDVNNDGLLDILSLDMKPFDDDIYKKSGGWENIQIYNYKRNFGYHHQSPRNALQVNLGTTSKMPHFSEQACYFGIEASDWSWTPLIADFDNDGDKDIYISNGIVKRPNDMDFINFDFKPNANTFDQLEKIPSGKVSNIYFENSRPDKKYTRYFDKHKTASTSAAYADLNLDGKIDIVINNINEKASVLKNNHQANKYLRLKLKGKSPNLNALGAVVHLHADGKTQTATINSSNGFLSHNESIIHFGIPNEHVDSLTIKWPGKNLQKLYPKVNDTLLVIQENTTVNLQKKLNTDHALDLKKLKNYQAAKQSFKGQETNKWLLFNEYSHSDQLHLHAGKLNVTSPNGIIKGEISNDEFIATTSVSSIFPAKLNTYLSNQKIHFYETADQNLDGLVDYFIHCDSSSFVLLSDKDDYKKLELDLATAINCATWGNINKDKNLELVIAGHWAPISVINFTDALQTLGYTTQDLPKSKGWWFTVTTADLDQDGDDDIIAGNFGTNHSLTASDAFPIKAYESDFDKNGASEKLITYFFESNEVPYPNQKLFVDQLPYGKKKFLKSKDYVEASITDLLGENRLKTAKVSTISELRSCYFLNNSSWLKKPLPKTCQLAPIFCIEPLADNTFYFGGNLFDVDPNLGRQDASTIQLLQYKDNKWNTANQDIFPMHGEVRDIQTHANSIYFMDKNLGIFVQSKK